MYVARQYTDLDLVHLLNVLLDYMEPSLCRCIGLVFPHFFLSLLASHGGLKREVRVLSLNSSLTETLQKQSAPQDSSHDQLPCLLAGHLHVKHPGVMFYTL